MKQLSGVYIDDDGTETFVVEDEFKGTLIKITRKRIDEVLK